MLLDVESRQKNVFFPLPMAPLSVHLIESQLSSSLPHPTVQNPVTSSFSYASSTVNFQFDSYSPNY